jgi:hypothetical protein
MNVQTVIIDVVVVVQVAVNLLWISCKNMQGLKKCLQQRKDFFRAKPFLHRLFLWNPTKNGFCRQSLEEVPVLGLKHVVK